MTTPPLNRILPRPGCTDRCCAAALRMSGPVATMPAEVAPAAISLLRESDPESWSHMVCSAKKSFYAPCLDPLRAAHTRGPKENSGHIGGFEKGEFEPDGARKEVAAQICVRRTDTVQLRAQKVNEPAKIRIVVQRDPLGVNEVVR